MNECGEFKKSLVRCFSKDLNSEEERLWREHLAKCSHCQEEFNRQQEIEAILERRPLSKAPAGLVEQVLSLIPEPEAAYARPSFNWRLLTSLAFGAVAWVMAAMAFYFKPQPGIFIDWGERLMREISRWSFDISNPFIVWGAVVYSLIFSISSLFIIRRFRLTFIQNYLLR